LDRIDVVNRDDRATLLGVASLPEGGERSGETMAKDEKRWSVRGCWSSDLTTVNERKEQTCSDSNANEGTARALSGNSVVAGSPKFRSLKGKRYVEVLAT
jgi:hypothetical protein